MKFFDVVAKKVSEVVVREIVCDYCGKTIWKEGEGGYSGGYQTIERKSVGWGGVVTIPFDMHFHNGCWEEVEKLASRGVSTSRRLSAHTRVVYQCRRAKIARGRRQSS